ncbi:hypothetical protein [Streptomyces sp. NPDC003327]
MRPAQDGGAGFSATPIFDALYSEYRRSFRTLPGDRSGEEELGFRAFGTAMSPSRYGQGQGYGGAASGQAAHRPAAYPAAWAALPPGPRRGL